MIFLSFCITVFNQLDLVRSCVESILASSSSEFEVVINDDCSTDDIKSLCESWNDDRVHYYRNETNLGHDLNILKCYENAQGEYLFLLRTRDCIIPTNVDDLISILKNDNKIVYLLSSALDEDGLIRFRFRKNVTSRSFFLNQRLNHCLLVHPSGFVFRKDAFDLERIRMFLTKNTDDEFIRMSFISHVLLRTALINCGEFYLAKEPFWVYTHTERAKDVANNKSKKGISVYSPEYTLKRHELLMKWINQTLPANFQIREYIFAYKNIMHTNTIRLYDRSRSVDLQYHYGYEPVSYDYKLERRKCIDLNRQLARDLNIHSFRYKLLCAIYPLLNSIMFVLHVFKSRVKVILYGFKQKC